MDTNGLKPCLRGWARAHPLRHPAPGSGSHPEVALSGLEEFTTKLVTGGQSGTSDIRYHSEEMPTHDLRRISS